MDDLERTLSERHLADFRELVKADEDIKSQLSVEEIDRVFSLDHYLRNIDTIYQRVFHN